MNRRHFIFGALLPMLSPFFRASQPDPLISLPAPAGSTQEESWVIGLDLGQAADYSACCVDHVVWPAQPKGQPRPAKQHAIRALKRWDLKTPYPEVVLSVARTAAKLPVPPILVIDATGVGAAVVDMFRLAKRQEKLSVTRLVPVTITGGNQETCDELGAWHVPKKNLVGCMHGPLQEGRLIVAPGLKEGPTLSREMSTFVAKIRLVTGNESFESWRERDHDDLTLACALCLWFSERGQRRITLRV